MSETDKIPTAVQLHRKSRELELAYEGGECYRLSCEYLRVMSPSAEVRGHGPGQEQLQWGKQQVNISDIKPVGNYALQLLFDDGHDSGIYAWPYLYELCVHHDQWWQDYLQQLHTAGLSRDPETQVMKLV